MKTWWWTAACCSKRKSAPPKSSATLRSRKARPCSGTVRSLTDYGAFVDIGGVDGLLHVADISWSRVNKPADVLKVGDKSKPGFSKSIPTSGASRSGMKQLQPHPWDAAAEKYKAGERVQGTVTRVTDFGAFVELEPGIEGLIHVSEMSWSKKVRKPSDVVKPGETVEVRGAWRECRPSGAFRSA